MNKVEEKKKLYTDINTQWKDFRLKDDGNKINEAKNDKYSKLLTKILVDLDKLVLVGPGNTEVFENGRKDHTKLKNARDLIKSVKVQ